MAFRQALGRFATGVTLVTTIDREGRPIAVTVNSFSSVSLEPPLVLFSLARAATRFADFEAAGRFAINVLTAEQQELSDRFARSGQDLLDGVPHRLGAHGCPLIEGALATFECRTEARHDGGDHDIFVGAVDAIANTEADGPLLYYCGRYRVVAASDTDEPS
ncbi:MAG: flavin reductase family protein [Alphaproteobacteria bacterium]|nr:flavin reductase family protein [Alphaproteobacteria bacterium]